MMGVAKIVIREVIGNAVWMWSSKGIMYRGER
jgi:hypothetical protein